MNLQLMFNTPKVILQELVSNINDIIEHCMEKNVRRLLKQLFRYRQLMIIIKKWN